MHNITSVNIGIENLRTWKIEEDNLWGSRIPDDSENVVVKSFQPWQVEFSIGRIFNWSNSNLLNVILFGQIA